jgi:hypothetical protein
MLEGKEAYGVLDLLFPVRDMAGHKWTCQEFMHSWAAVQLPVLVHSAIVPEILALSSTSSLES